MLYSRSSYLSLPSKPGVYVFLDKKNTILYVGKAIDVKSRVSSYFTGSHLGEKTRLLVTQIDKIRITLVESELEALLLEAYYIKKYNPRFNIRLTDNKAYILVRITVNDMYPRILLARKMEYENDMYFGPFPSSSTVRLVLKSIRRVFPYVSVENHPKRICLYNHLGLCPCPPVFDSPELRKEYKKNIRGILRVFEGESRKILSELEKQRDEYSNNEQFEQAAALQKRITALQYIMQPFHKPHEYDINPNLRSDIRQEELMNIKQILNKHGSPIENLHRIECYDISHIQGTNTTASMVVFTNGEKDSSQYRKFKIRTLKKKKVNSPSAEAGRTQSSQMNGTPSVPDDFASMQEVLSRRFKHDEWQLPGLLIVDGGKGQVSSALQVLEQMNIHIPLIGLAKREETIIIPEKEDRNKLTFKEVLLPKDTKALQLIMRIRDEAHRFAITYHRKLRSKASLR